MGPVWTLGGIQREVGQRIFPRYHERQEGRDFQADGR
jgi:hypothetical protein